MSGQHATDKNSAARIDPPVTPKAPWRVTRVRPLEDFKLQVWFVDELSGIVDMRRLIHSGRAGVFASLADEEQFERVYVELGAPTWPGDIALAPDALHEQIKKTGQAAL